ncbi:hypothetical protein OSB04_024480 [Centaurea solstitialis]|uniref:Uncharacterized protein n=1 Tax=Centaurea solstitialis TaxID=347529 RepID=A0AA38STP3_9ASTR|nr:hypothetical protein OSB04_024480 [Centaurea solstitialis]
MMHTFCSHLRRFSPCMEGEPSKYRFMQVTHTHCMYVYKGHDRHAVDPNGDETSINEIIRFQDA